MITPASTTLAAPAAMESRKKILILLLVVTATITGETLMSLPDVVEVTTLREEIAITEMVVTKGEILREESPSVVVITMKEEEETTEITTTEEIHMKEETLLTDTAVMTTEEERTLSHEVKPKTGGAMTIDATTSVKDLITEEAIGIIETEAKEITETDLPAHPGLSFPYLPALLSLLLLVTSTTMFARKMLRTSSNALVKYV